MMFIVQTMLNSSVMITVMIIIITELVWWNKLLVTDIFSTLTEVISCVICLIFLVAVCIMFFCHAYTLCISILDVFMIYVMCTDGFLIPDLLVWFVFGQR